MLRHAPPRCRSSRRSAQGGFTLIEMLVVMTIIIFLMSILIITVGNVMETAKIAATEATIKKVEALLNDRLESFNMAWDKNRFEGPIRQKENDLKSAYNFAPPIASALAPMLVRKDLERQYFPQSFTEVFATTDTNSHTNRSIPVDFGFRLDPSVRQLHLDHPNTFTPATESAEVLYWMLTQSEVLGSIPTGDADFLESELADTDGDGRLEIVDAWGKPLRFYRWPTRLVRPDGLTTVVDDATVNDTIRLDTTSLLMTDFGKDFLGQDVDDVLGQIPAQFGDDDSTALPQAEAFEQIYHTIYTLHPFLIVSAGADEELGLYEPTDVPNFGHLARPRPETLGSPGDSVLNDNITNHQATGARN